MRVAVITTAILFVFCGTASADVIGLFGGSSLGIGTQQRLTLTVSGQPFPSFIQASNAGWWDSGGIHDAANTNYASGVLTPPDVPAVWGVNDFFAFSIPRVTGTITAASLSIWNPSNGFFNTPSPSSPVTFAFYDVSTPIPQLVASGTARTDIYLDLGSGVPYASRSVSATDNGTQVLFDLNSDALASLNAAKGASWATGGSVGLVAPIPEPASFILLGTGIGVIALAVWRRRK